MTLYIPGRTEERVLELYQSIKPVKLTDDGYHEVIGYTDQRRLKTYLFSIKPERITTPFKPRYALLGELINGLSELATIDTHHQYTSERAFFKQSIAEVLAQIPQKYIKRTVAFSIKDNYDGLSWPTGESDYECFYTKTTLFEDQEKSKRIKFLKDELSKLL